jgi:hypothetical protein
MARKPTAQPPSGGAPRGRRKTDETRGPGERAEPGEHAGRGRPAEPDERYGPVAIERMRKDDGRSLIIYSREDGGAT